MHKRRGDQPGRCHFDEARRGEALSSSAEFLAAAQLETTGWRLRGEPSLMYTCRQEAAHARAITRNSPQVREPEGRQGEPGI
jgi:hypothetical protein